MSFINQRREKFYSNQMALISVYNDIAIALDQNKRRKPHDN